MSDSQTTEGGKSQAEIDAGWARTRDLEDPTYQRGYRAGLGAVAEGIRALHVPWAIAAHQGTCRECGWPYPCSSRRLVDGP